jgi:DNA-binding response OmpR family regulator
MRLLLVEDDLKIAFFIIDGLRQAGFVVEHQVDGRHGLHQALNEDFDAAIVDLMLPGCNGLTLIQELRKQKNPLPILILSAKRSVDDRVKGLQSGGDDYLVKPFAFSELLARLQALIRRSGEGGRPTTYSVANLTLDIHSRKVYRDKVQIELQPLEFKILEYLLRHGGQVVSKTMIMENVWEYSFNPSTNVVEARICYLREKIDKPFEPKLIHTIRGMGYVLEERA